MYSLHSEHPTSYSPLPESATTMQIVSYILANATEEPLKPNQNFLVIEKISDVPPSFIHRLQQELGIRTLVFPVAGKNTIVFPPEARDRLYAYAVKELEKTMAVYAQATR